jgi:hypothetical protein
MKGTPIYTTLETTKLETEVRLHIAGKWRTKEEVGKDADRVWGDLKIDLSSLDEVDAIELKFTVTTNADSYKTAYSIDKIKEDVEFGIRVRNSGSRSRRFKKGSTTLKTGTGKAGKNVLIGEVVIELNLREFAGEIELEPIFVSKKAMHDRKMSTTKFSVDTQRGTILGWADPTVVILERALRGLSSLFDFEWVQFSQRSDLGLRDSEYFAIKWDSRPIIYLNQDVENLETVLTSTSKRGAVANARNSLDAAIAQQAISVALSASILAAREMKYANENLSDEDVLDSLNPQDRMVLRAWLHAVDPDASGEKTPVADSLSRILEMSDLDLQRCLVETMPKNLQVSMGSKNSSEQLLTLVGRSQNNGDQ